MKLTRRNGISPGLTGPDVSTTAAAPSRTPGRMPPRLLTTLIGTALAAALPMLAQAQTGEGCGGAISVATDPNSTPPNQIPYTGAPLGETVRVMLTPAKGEGTLDLVVDEIDYALVCADNLAQVPCANGNDTAPGGGLPVEFAGNVSGTCGATDATTVNNGDGTVSFLFDPQALSEEGCTVEFDVTVNDIGTDSTPFQLTGAAQTTGLCDSGTDNLQGSAAGSVAIFLQTVPDVQLIKEISVDGGESWVDANDSGTAPTLPFPAAASYRLTASNAGTATLIEVTVEDTELGIPATAIDDLAPGDILVIDSGTAGFEALDVAERCGNAGTFTNTALISATSADDASTVTDTDPAVLICVGTPDIQIAKEISLDGMDWFDAKDAENAVQTTFPSDAQYRLTVTNTGTTDLFDVTVNDPTLGLTDYIVGSLMQGEVAVLDQTTVSELQVMDRCTNSGDFFNTASVSGSASVPETTVNDSDVAVLSCVGNPDLELVKEVSIDGETWFDANDVGSGPTALWPSDAQYRITVRNVGTAPLVNVTVSDADLGLVDVPIADLDAGAEVVLTAEVMGFEALFVQSRCDSAGTFFNNAESSAESGETGEVVTAGDAATLRCIGDPEIQLVKEVSLDGETWFDANTSGSAPTAPASSDLYYRVTITNIGTADLENILVSDATLGLIDVMVGSLAIGESAVFTSDSDGFEGLLVADACLDSGLVPNTASAYADSVETGGMGETVTVSDSDSALVICEPQQANGDLEICRSPGFWSTHAGSEKKNSSNLAQAAIDAAGGSLSICGTTVTNTDVGNSNSALEALCVRVQGDPQRQLIRQLTAMALNCVVSGADGDCTGTSVEELFLLANEACMAGGDLSMWIDQVDNYNNGELGDCSSNELSSSDVFEGIAKLPGSAGSARACNEARKNDVYVKP